MADTSKITTMLEWPKPKNVQSLRGFLGLTRYYWKFIKGYRIIAALLTTLQKKNSFFMWDLEAKKAFEALNVPAPSVKTSRFQQPLHH